MHELNWVIKLKNEQFKRNKITLVFFYNNKQINTYEIQLYKSTKQKTKNRN